MPYYRDFREYLAALDSAGKLRTVSRKIDKDTELHPLVRWQFRGLQESQWTGWLFNNLAGHGRDSFEGSVATGVIGANREIYAIGLKCREDEIHDKWVKALEAPRQPVVVDASDAECKEVIHVGEDLLSHGGLDEFPIPMATNGWEGLPRLTAVSWHTRDPETGVLNVGTYNGLVTGQLRTSCRCPFNQLSVHWQKARQAGKPLQAAAVIGAVPAVSMASVAKVPRGVSEHAVAGGLMGEPLPVVRCETVDIDVPASAEIVLEGEIATDWLEPDGASGEHTGYTIIGGEVFAFRITAITHRRSPIWHDYMSQMPPSESSTLRGIAEEANSLKFLQKDCGIAEVKAAAFHHSGGAYRVCVLQMQDIAGVRTHTSIVWQAMLATMARDVHYPKIVIAVDSDIDPSELRSVLWALSFRYQPHRDTKIIQGRGGALDQSATPYAMDALPGEDYLRYPRSSTSPEGASAILMDATRKWDYTPVSLPKREYMERAREIWSELGLPELDPVSPWYGESLGIWPDEYAVQAELGAAGDFLAVQERLLGGGRHL